MRRWRALLGVFLIGFLLGLAMMNLFHMHTLDRLYRVQNQLTNQLLDREIKLEKLNDNIENQKATIVKDLMIQVEFEGSPLVKDEIQKNIHFYLTDLVGRELWNIDGEMIYKILDQRIIEVGQRQVQLKTKYIIISEKITIAVKAQTIEKL